MLDEPTSGLDPIVRREFIQDRHRRLPGRRPGTADGVRSTHLISEFEGLIDEFTIIDGGRELLSLEADDARGRFQKIQARFAGDYRRARAPGVRSIRRQGREIKVVTDGNSAESSTAQPVHRRMSGPRR